jgi:hypothetical protein
VVAQIIHDHRIPNPVEPTGFPNCARYLRKSGFPISLAPPWSDACWLELWVRGLSVKFACPGVKGGVGVPGVTVSSTSPAWASTAREYAYTEAATWGPERGDGEACFGPDGEMSGLRDNRKDGRGVVVERSVSSGDCGGGQALWLNSTSVSKTVAPSTRTPAAPRVRHRPVRSREGGSAGW